MAKRKHQNQNKKKRGKRKVKSKKQQQKKKKERKKPEKLNVIYQLSCFFIYTFSLIGFKLCQISQIKM